MLGILAQAASESESFTALTNNTTTDSGLSGFFGGAFIVTFLLIGIVVYVVMVISLWKIFEKAGVEGWKAIIPIYNNWVMAEIAGKPGWWALVSLGGIIPLVGFIASIAGLVLFILISIELVKKFGKDTGFALLLIFLPVIGYPILGFGDAKYQGGSSQPVGSGAATPPTTPATPAA